MRIRSFLALAFLVATLLPSTILSWQSYQDGLQREFAEVKDRHLLLAQNVAMALERYHSDLVGTFYSLSASLLAGNSTPNLEALMSSINMLCVLIVDGTSGEIVARADVNPSGSSKALFKKTINVAMAIAKPGKTTFSEVIPTDHDGNVLLGVRRYGDKIAIAVVSTRYFVELGKSISFGKKGHAAIVDSAGNVLAHPLPSWVKSRKNIAKVSAVRRMMNGETGIEKFYSPALKEDMVAGLTIVRGPGWGVMIPQPVQELYDKVYDNNKGILIVFSIGLIITAIFVFLLMNSLASPLERLLRAMKANAEEKKLKNIALIPGAIPLSEIAQFNNNYNTMVDRVSEANEKISSMAYSDGVTGLPNREKLEALAEDLFNKCNSPTDGGALIFVDLDDFKQINDVYGHSIGDDFLRDCATKLGNAVHVQQRDRIGVQIKSDNPIIARIGGDEFAILYPGLINKGEIRRLLVLLHKELSAPSSELNYITKRSASIGCSRYPQDGNKLEDLIKLADIAMYSAKKSGKNKSRIYSRNIGIMTTSELRAEVENAIVNDALVLEYQPKIRTSDQKAVGVEALVRWNHPTLGRLPPNDWIPAITNSPVIKQLGEWVIARAMDDHKRWTDAGLDISVAINIGSEHFSSPDFVDHLTQTAGAKNFDAQCMEIEITEDTLFTSGVIANNLIDRLHTHGYRIAIDDFGTGYSNIARLSKLAVDCLKIDRSVISQASGDERVASMMECIILMADKLGCETVAEGVETSGDVLRSSSVGIDILQGFYFSASMPVDELIEWVTNFETDEAVSDEKDPKSSIAAA